MHTAHSASRWRPCWRELMSPSEVFARVPRLQLSITLAIALLLCGGRSPTAPPFTLHPWNPIQEQHILPDSPKPSESQDRIETRAARGEIESASFVIHSDRELRRIEIKAGAFRDAVTGTVLPESVSDVRLVKAWFQAGDHFRMRKNRRVLVPELLLKDNDLVRVDLVRGRQRVRLKSAAGSRYHDISQAGSRLPGVGEIHDADQLQPFSMEPGRSQQVWLTLRVPKDTEPGRYLSTIEVVAGGVRNTIECELTVLPFMLDAARLETSLYYRGRLDPKPAIQRGWNIKEPDAYSWDMASLMDHGVQNPTFTHYGSPVPHVLLDQELAIRRAAGMSAGPVYMDGLTLGKPSKPKELAAVRRKVTHWLRWFADRGYGPVHFYGVDEAKNHELEPQLAGWKLARELGGRVMVAGYVGSAEVAAPHLDLPILAYEPDAAEAKRYQRHGQRVFSYANPQVGLEDPLAYRTNYGFRLWKAGYDGSMTYAYQHAYGDIWNDFDTPSGGFLRDHVFAYPTDSGLIDTVQYEAFREAIDDLRYLATLESRIERVVDPAERSRHRDWLEALDVDRPPEAVRLDLITRILALEG